MCLESEKLSDGWKDLILVIMPMQSISNILAHCMKLLWNLNKKAFTYLNCLQEKYKTLPQADITWTLCRLLGGEEREGSVGHTQGSQDFGSLEAGAALASYITKYWDLTPSNMMSIKEVVLQFYYWSLIDHLGAKYILSNYARGIQNEYFLDWLRR